VAAARRVVQVSDQAQLESTINSYIAEGFSVQNRTPAMAVLYKKKEFSVLWAVVGFIFCVLPLLVYVIVYASQSDQYVEIRLTAEPSSPTLPPPSSQ
jgi:ABC-type Fe3+ transport system permease subunit